MKATLTLDEGELKQAVLDYLDKNGWKGSKIEFYKENGYDDPREPAASSGPTYSCTAVVEAKR